MSLDHYEAFFRRAARRGWTRRRICRRSCRRTASRSIAGSYCRTSGRRCWRISESC